MRPQTHRSGIGFPLPPLLQRLLVAGVAAEGLAGDKSRGQIHRQDGFCWLATGYIVHAGCGYGGQRVFVDPA